MFGYNPNLGDIGDPTWIDGVFKAVWIIIDCIIKCAIVQCVGKLKKYTVVKEIRYIPRKNMAGLIRLNIQSLKVIVSHTLHLAGNKTPTGNLRWPWKSTVSVHPCLILFFCHFPKQTIRLTDSIYWWNKPTKRDSFYPHAAILVSSWPSSVE